MRPRQMLGPGHGKFGMPAWLIKAFSLHLLQKFGLLNDDNIQMLIRRVEMTLFLPSWVSFQDFVAVI